MSRESERVFREMHKAMEGKIFENEEQANEFISNFINEYNNKSIKNESLFVAVVRGGCGVIEKSLIIAHS